MRNYITENHIRNVVKDVIDESVRGIPKSMLNDDEEPVLIGHCEDVDGKVRFYIGAVYNPYEECFDYIYCDTPSLDNKVILTTYQLNNLREVIDPKWINTTFWYDFYNHYNPKQLQKKHDKFMSRLNIEDGHVILRHDSSAVFDGCVDKFKGRTQNYSNNSDFNGNYFWASKLIGKDPSNVHSNHYYCKVPVDSVYDFSTDMEYYGSINIAAQHYPVVALYWEGGPEIVAVAKDPVEIFYSEIFNGGFIIEPKNIDEPKRKTSVSRKRETDANPLSGFTSPHGRR